MAMNNMGAGFTVTGKDNASPMLKKFSAGLKGVKNLLGNVGVAMAALGAASFKMGTSVIGGLMGLADVAGDFEQGLAKIGGITNATSKEMALLRDTAIQAGVETQFSPQEAIEGLTDLASAGMKATSASKALVPVLDLAAGSLGQLGVGEAAKAVVGTLNSYSLSADKAGEVTDKLLRVTQLSNFQARDFAVGLGKVTAIGGVMNQGLDDLLVTMGQLRNRNIDASSSATALREVIRRVSSDQGAQQSVMKTGTKIYDKHTGKLRSVVDIMMDLADKTEKYTDKKRDELITTAFGARGMLAYAAVANATFSVMKDGEEVLLKGRDAIEAMRLEMGKSAGTAEFFKNKLLDTFEGQKTLLRGTLETLQVVAGEPLTKIFKPIVGYLVLGLNAILKAFNALPMPVKEMIMGVITVGGVILTAVGAFVAFISVMSLMGITFTGLISSLVSFTALIVPLTILVTGFGVGAVAAFKAMTKEGKDTGSAMGNIAQQFKLGFQGIVEILRDGKLSDAFREELTEGGFKTVVKFLDGFKAFTVKMKAFWDGLVVGFEIGVQRLMPIVQQIKEEFGGVFAMFDKGQSDNDMEGWINNGISAGELLASTGESVLNIFLKVVKIFKEVSASMGDITSQDIMSGIKDFVSLFEGLKTTMSVLSGIFGVVYNTLKLIGSFIGELAGRLLDMGGGFLDGIASLVQGDTSGMSQWWERQTSPLEGFVETRAAGAGLINAFAGDEVVTTREQDAQREFDARVKPITQSQPMKDRNKAMASIADSLNSELMKLKAQGEAEKDKAKREKIDQQTQDTLIKLNAVIERLAKNGVTAEVSFEAVADAANQHKKNDAGRNLAGGGLEEEF